MQIVMMKLGPLRMRGEYRVDEKGIGYSLDGHRLLFVQHTFKDSEYIVPNGVVTICSMAFASCRQFVTLIIPRSVRLIGDFVFGPEGGKIVICVRDLS